MPHQISHQLFLVLPLTALLVASSAFGQPPTGEDQTPPAPITIGSYVLVEKAPDRIYSATATVDPDLKPDEYLQQLLQGERPATIPRVGNEAENDELRISLKDGVLRILRLEDGTELLNGPLISLLDERKRIAKDSLGVKFSGKTILEGQVVYSPIEKNFYVAALYRTRTSFDGMYLLLRIRENDPLDNWRYMHLGLTGQLDKERFRANPTHYGLFQGPALVYLIWPRVEREWGKGTSGTALHGESTGENGRPQLHVQMFGTYELDRIRAARAESLHAAEKYRPETQKQ